MEALERQASRIMAATKQAELDAANGGGAAAEENPEEIDLDDEFDLDGDEVRRCAFCSRVPSFATSAHLFGTLSMALNVSTHPTGR